MKYFVSLTIFIIPFLHEAAGACDFTCGEKKHVCADETSFYRCANSVPIFDAAIKCPSGLFCNDDPQKCSSAEPTCQTTCSTCDATNNVACISKHEFNYCINNVPQSEMYGSCVDEFCDASNPDICSTTAHSCNTEPQTTTIAPVTTPTPPTTSTPDFTARCIAGNKAGKFKSNDCKKYIYCRPLGNGKLIGQEYTCPYHLQFDCTIGQCVKYCNLDRSCDSI